MSTFTVVSLFCGLGGLDLGFEMQGYKIIWANDILPNAAASYELNFGLRPQTEDITKIQSSDIPSADVVIGGPPCQSFSLVGKREPGDERGQLVYAFRRIVLDKRPRAFVLENVPGMAASLVDGRRLPEVLADEFEAVGYSVSLMRLTATDYMVPQLRKRLFLVGCLGGQIELPVPDIFARECLGVDRSSIENSARSAIGDLGPCTRKGENARYRNTRPSTFAEWMRVANGDDVTLHECPRLSNTDRVLVAHIPPGGNYMDIPDHIAPKRAMKFKETGGRTTTYGRLHPDRPSYTINTYFRRPNVGCNFHYAEERLITPREAMRFQAFPDRFQVVHGSQDGRNALIGNAVPSLLARAVSWTLLRTLCGQAPLARLQAGLPFSAVRTARCVQ